MARYIQKGDVIDYTPSSDVAAGDVVVVGDALVGLAARDIPANTLGSLIVSGVWECPKNTNEQISAGAVVYWDATHGYVTKTATNNVKLGLAAESAAQTAATIRVLVR